MSRVLLALFSNVLFSAPPILLVLVYARIGSYEESALLGLALAVCAPLQLFFSMQHGISILSGKVSVETALSMRVLLVAPLLFVSFVVSLFLNESIVLIFAFYKIGDFLYEPFFYQYIKRSDLTNLFSQSVFRFLVQVLFGSIGFYLSADILTLILLLALINIILPIMKITRFWGGMSVGLLHQYTSGFFLGASALGAALCINLPRYFLTGIKTEDFAAYSNLLTIVMGGTLLFGAFNNVFFARATSGGAIGVIGFLKKSIIITVVGVLVSNVFVMYDNALSKIFISIFLGSSYSEYYSLVFGFAVFYCALYTQNSLNLCYVYFSREREFMFASAMLFIVLFVVLYVFTFILFADVEVIVWAVTGVYLLFCALMCMLCSSVVRKLS